MKKDYKAPTYEELSELVGTERADAWVSLCSEIEKLYDTERIWNDGGKRWAHEYKYRRGGKTLCGLYAKENETGFMVILGKDERDRFEAIRSQLSNEITECYDAATTFHDGKWVMFPLLDKAVFNDYIKLLAIKRKPNRK